MTPDDFNPAEIEAMQVEFVECPNCKGVGQLEAGPFIFRCNRCFGTGCVEKEGENVEVIYSRENNG